MNCCSASAGFGSPAARHRNTASWARVQGASGEKVEDACKVGDMMWVKVTDIDEKGRVNLSHKDAVKEIKAKEAAGERIK